MGKRLIIKGADFSSVAVSKEDVYKDVSVGTSKSLWGLATTKLTALEMGTGYPIQKTGKIVGMTIKADNDGFIALATFRKSSGSWERQHLSGHNLVEGMNTIELDIPVEEDDLILVNVRNQDSPISYGYANGDYPTVLDGVVDDNPNTLPFNFELIYLE